MKENRFIRSVINVLEKFPGVSGQKQEIVYADGTSKFSDKKEVGDPTLNFSTISYTTKRLYDYRLARNVEFKKSEYDLDTLANAVQIDGYLRRAVNIYVEQILKNSFEFVSKNTRLQKHITRRVKEIENLTDISFNETITTIARQLVTYGNAYLIKVRDKDLSNFGSQFRLHGKNLYPVIGLFIAEASTVQIGLNDLNEIVNYKQIIKGNETIFDARDVIHLTYNKIPGTLTGMSSILPVLDDIRALRKLEEEVEILGFQYSIPLYLYKVGNKDLPPAPGEIESVRNTINTMPAYGMLVVPGNHTIEVPTNNNSPIDLISFINHFKERVFSGLGVSSVAMGISNTSNRNTSEVLDMSMQTITLSYQRIIKEKIELELVREFMLDGGFDTIEESIEMRFPEIDQESQIKKETNIIAKWQNNLITRDEARLEMDYDTKMNEKEVFLELVTIPEIEAKLSVIAMTKPAASSTTAPKKSISNKNQPENQHGKLNSRPKIARDILEDTVTTNNKLLDNFIENGTINNINRVTYKDKVNILLHDTIYKQVGYTINKYKEFYHLELKDTREDIVLEYMNNISLLLNDKIARLLKDKDTNKTTRIYQVTKDFILDQSDKIDNLVKCIIYNSLGFKTILINVEDCSLHSTYNLTEDDLRNLRIPPFEYGCKCRVDEESLNEYK